MSNKSYAVRKYTNNVDPLHSTGLEALWFTPDHLTDGNSQMAGTSDPCLVSVDDANELATLFGEEQVEVLVLLPASREQRGFCKP